MRTYVFLMKGKRRGELTPELLARHVEHLRRLWDAGHLILCGPFQDDDGAMQVLRANSAEQAQAFFEADPFIVERYYVDHDVHELLEASPANGWLMQADQTKANLR